MSAIQVDRAVDEQPQHLRFHLHPHSGIKEAKSPIIGLELIEPINHLVSVTLKSIAKTDSVEIAARIQPRVGVERRIHG